MDKSLKLDQRVAQALRDADDISARITAGGYRSNLSDTERLRNHVRALAAGVQELTAAKTATSVDAAEVGRVIQGLMRELRYYAPDDDPALIEGKEILASLAASPPSVAGEIVDALRWYADPISYAVTQMNEPRSAVHGDGGRRARAALGTAGDPA